MLPAIVMLVSLVAQATPQPGNTGLIRGRVIEKETGRPLPRAMVALRPSSGSAQQAIADERGEFEFNRLAPGSHTLVGAAGEHRATHVTTPYSRPGDRYGSPFLVLKAGEVLTDVEIALPRAMAISGQVVDDVGAPLANVVLHLRIVESTPGFVFGESPSTDDRGHFRAFGIPTGRYIVCADPDLGPSFTQVRVRRTQHAHSCSGEVVLTNDAVAGVVIQLPRVPTYTIRGRVIGADGNLPTPTGITLARIEVERQRTVSSPQFGDDGSFVISDIVPGKYELSAFGGFRPDQPVDPSQRQWTGMSIDISTADVDGVVLQLSRGATLRGRVIYEDPPASPDPVRGLEVRAEPMGFRTARLPTAIPAEVGDDGRFALSGLFGPLALRVSMPRGHLVKSIAYRGRDIHQVPTVFLGDPAHEAVVLLTGRVCELSGRGTWTTRGRRRLPRGCCRFPPIPRGGRRTVAVFASASRMAATAFRS